MRGRKRHSRLCFETRVWVFAKEFKAVSVFLRTNSRRIFKTVKALRFSSSSSLSKKSSRNCLNCYMAQKRMKCRPEQKRSCISLAAFFHFVRENEIMERVNIPCFSSDVSWRVGEDELHHASGAAPLLFFTHCLQKFGMRTVQYHMGL